MKTTSTCERNFVSTCIIKGQKRLDGRQLVEGRTIEIAFGIERGCCMTLLGNTRVLAQISCEVTKPRLSSLSEGILHVNLELSAMAAPEARSFEEAAEAQVRLERCIRDSRCVDLEALCIVSGLKVWTIRADIHTLNDDGNIIECASIAAISALAHFRYPQVTVDGTDVIVHALEEKEPRPLRIRHMPISVNLALYEQGKYILVDPTEIEERIADGCYIIALNAHQEICAVHRHGVLLLKEEVIQRCEDIAVIRAQKVTQVIKNALDDDAYKRTTNAAVGFSHLIRSGTILGAKHPIAEIPLDSLRIESAKEELELVGPTDRNAEILDISEDGEKTHKVESSSAKRRAIKFLKTATMIQDHESAIFERGPSKWSKEEDNESSEESSEEDAPEGKQRVSKWSKKEEEESSEEESAKNKLNVSSVKEEVVLDSDEETVPGNKDQYDTTPSARGWYSKDICPKVLNYKTDVGAKHPIEMLTHDAFQNKATKGEPEIIEITDKNDIEILDISEDKMTHEVRPSIAKSHAMKFLKTANKVQNQKDEEKSSAEEEAPEGKSHVSSVKEEIVLDSDDETVSVNKDQLDMKPNTRGWYFKDPFK